MTTYCRSISEPCKYFEATAMIDDGEFPEVFWRLRRMGRDSNTLITACDYHENYVTCSPFEAISSITK